MEGKKILIVDDEKNIRNVIKEYAKFDGFETFEAEDGMQAVEMCRTQDFDLIIMDIMMPKLDGYSAVREIRKTKQIPVIMLSRSMTSFSALSWALMTMLPSHFLPRSCWHVSVR